MSSAQSVRLPTKSTVSLSCSIRNACESAPRFRCVHLHGHESKGVDAEHSALSTPGKPSLTNAYKSIIEGAGPDALEVRHVIRCGQRRAPCGPFTSIRYNRCKRQHGRAQSHM